MMNLSNNTIFQFKIVILLAVFFSFIPNDIGAGGASCGAVSCQGHIKRLYSTSGGTTYVELSGVSGIDSRLCGGFFAFLCAQNELIPGNCQLVSKVYFRMDATAHEDHWMSMLLTAKATNRHVDIRTVSVGSGEDCRISYIVLS